MYKPVEDTRPALIYKETGDKIIGFLVKDASGEERVVRCSPRKGKPIHAPEDALEWLYIRHQAELLDDREHFIVVYLDTRRRVIDSRVLSTGTLDTSLVHPREVFAPAFELRASAVVVAHNHPSCDPEPSPEDIALTSRLDRASRLLGFRLVDHLIIGKERGWVSMRQRQMDGEYRGQEMFS